MLRLNVGYTKKVGEANFGSRGASANLELELDSSLAGDADRLKERVRYLYALAKQSVEEELAAAPGTVGNGHPASNGNGTATPSNGTSRRRDNTRRATASQVRALNAIADRAGIDLGEKLLAAYGTREPTELSIVEASQCIDQLKGAGNGTGGRR